MVDDRLAGRVDEARALAKALLPLVLALFAEPNPAVIKGVLHAQGGCRRRTCGCRSATPRRRAVDRALAAIAGAAPARA